MKPSNKALFRWFVVFLALSGCVPAGSGPGSGTATSTSTSTSTSNTSSSVTATHTATGSGTATSTATSTASSSATATSTASLPVTNTATNTQTITKTQTQTVVSTSSATSTSTVSSSASGPVTSLHYSAGCAGCGLGFNLADVSSASELNALPAGTLGLVWLGLCNGADANFQSTVNAFKGNAKLYGFYVMDEPDPTGQWAPLCTPANLKAEADYIHANLPGTQAFIVMMNLGSDTAPSYAGGYTPANTDLDLFGLDPYPCKTAFGGCNYAVIGSGVAAAEAVGIPASKIVPVYQAFGGGGYSDWLVPSAAEATQNIATWAPLAPTPTFDYVYAWGQQENDTSLSMVPALQTVFQQHNNAK